MCHENACIEQVVASKKVSREYNFAHVFATPVYVESASRYSETAVIARHMHACNCVESAVHGCGHCKMDASDCNTCTTSTSVELPANEVQAVEVILCWCIHVRPKCFVGEAVHDASARAGDGKCSSNLAMSHVPPYRSIGTQWNVDISETFRKAVRIADVATIVVSRCSDRFAKRLASSTLRYNVSMHRLMSKQCPSHEYSSL